MMQENEMIGQSFVTDENYVYKITGFLKTSEEFLATQVFPYPAQPIKINKVPGNWEKIS